MKYIVSLCLLLSSCTASFGLASPASQEDLNRLTQEAYTAFKQHEKYLKAMSELLAKYRVEYPLKEEKKEVKKEEKK